MAKYDKYGRRKTVRWDIIVPAGLLTILVGGLITFLVIMVNDTNRYEDQFTAKCTAAGGHAMFTRDMDFCLNGNTILFMNN